MHKIIELLTIASMVFLSCGPSAVEKAAEKQRIQDSIAAAEAEAAEAAEAARKKAELQSPDTIKKEVEILVVNNVKYLVDENFNDIISFDLTNNSEYNITNILFTGTHGASANKKIFIKSGQTKKVIMPHKKNPYSKYRVRFSNGIDYRLPVGFYVEDPFQ